MAHATKVTRPVSQEKALINVSNIQKSFGTNRLLDGVDFSLAPGERLSILGAGGSGKSTLLKIIMSLVPSDGGDVELMGSQLKDLSRNEKQAVLKRVSMAFQLGGLFDFLTVRENILFAMENMTDMRPGDMEEVVIDLLRAVNLPLAGNKLPSELSGGMRRRVGIVRALATKPELALLDEPTAGLDPVTSSVVIDMIHKLADKLNTTCLCVTGSVEVAFTFSERVAILKDGKLVQVGTWDELHAVNDEWINHFLDVRDFQPAAK